MRKLTEMLSRRSVNRSLAAAADDDDDDDGDDGCQMSAEVQSQLLRTIATLCCVEDSLVQFNEVHFCAYLSL